jgi:hypothetical protein
LVLFTSVRKTSSGANIISAQFNGSSANFTQRYLDGNGSSASSSTTTSAWAGWIVGSDYTASTFSNNSMYIPNYLSSTNKSYSIDGVIETNGTTSYMGLVAGLWSNTAAITSITLTNATGDFTQYSTATLYGIKKA